MDMGYTGNHDDYDNSTSYYNFDHDHHGPAVDRPTHESDGGTDG